jgi:trk system potassium uptake protein TrkA
VVIERNADRADQVADDHDCLVLNADATVKETLEDAGPAQADAVISTTDQDATNIMVCLLAKELDIPTIVSVVQNPDHMGIFEQIGVNMMENPQELIAEYLYRAVARPAIIDYLRIGEDAEVFEITVTEEAPIAELTLSEAAKEGLVPDEVLIVAIARNGDGHPITPRGSTRIEVGDLLTVYSGFGADPDLTDMFGHYKDRPK